MTTQQWAKIVAGTFVFPSPALGVPATPLFVDPETIRRPGVKPAASPSSRPDAKRPT